MLVLSFDEDHDFASDTAVLKDGTDPDTGTRYLEDIAFEVVFEQSESKINAKVPRMLRRGVRRVFGVFIKQGEVREWVKKKGQAAGWVILAPEAKIQDKCLAVPLSVAAILDAARRDDAVARALIAKNNPVITEHLAQHEARVEARGEARGKAIGEAKGKAIGKAIGEARGKAIGEARGKAIGDARGKAEAILAILERRGIEPSDAVRRRVLGCTDLATLDRWLPEALVAVSADDLT